MLALLRLSSYDNCVRWGIVVGEETWILFSRANLRISKQLCKEARFIEETSCSSTDCSARRPADCR